MAEEWKLPKCRILSNAKLTNYFPELLETIYFQIKKTNRRDRFLNILGLIKMMGQVDVFIALNPSIEEMIVAFINKCVLRRKSITIFWDMNLQRPANLCAKMIGWLKAVLLHGVDKFFCVHKDTTGYELDYRIQKSKFLYIPFKANNYNIVHKYESNDKGYVLACGASLRDYETFVRAIEQVSFPAKIVLPNHNVASYHNTSFYEGNLPANVIVLRHNLKDRDLWNRYIAEARVVVVPIQERAIQPAGISVYLEAMALGKPVIVTEGPSTRGILKNENEAEIVPPSNAIALAAALRKLWEDKEYREQLACRGKEYALSLGNETRLVKDILRNAMACVAIKVI